jgi:hypothetical protein
MAQDDERGTALVLLGGTGLALMLTLKGICALLQRREALTGRPITRVEYDAIMEAVQIIPALKAEVAGIKATLPALCDKLDDLIARSNRRRATDD